MNKLSSAALPVLASLALGACALGENIRQDILHPQTTPAAAAAPAARGAPLHPLLHPLFADHAVLQRDKPIRVWGWTRAGADVDVTLGEARASAVADASGRWQASLPAMHAGGPYLLAAHSSAGETAAASDVLIGDVWLCSGQSNMEFTLRHATNADTEVANAADDNLRLLTVPDDTSATPLDSFRSPVRWSVSAPDSARDFSAVCYFTGRDLQGALGVPVGLIASSWGGTRIQAWISELGLSGMGDYAEALSLMDFHAASPEAAQRSWDNIVALWWRTHDPGSMAPVPWSAPNFDDAAWPSMTPNSFWEEDGPPALSNFDGVVWFRTAIEVSAAQARQSATLELGPIDDVDSTWVNGARVGGFEGWNTPRIYSVPAGGLRPGRNVIAVGVLDVGGGGGMHGGPGSKALRFADGTSADLSGPWRYQISAPLSQTGAAPQTPWLGENGLAMLNNAMIAPLAPYGLRGAAWYQGEANVSEPAAYQRLLPAMMADWRRQFATPDLPFLIVQLANYGAVAAAPAESGWAGVREAQRLTAAGDANAGMAVTIDIGDPYDIHPTNKREVGRRLANVARVVAYRQPNVDAYGPTPLRARAVRRGVEVTFANTGDHVVVWGGSRPLAFELCDAARKCVYVDATVRGRSVVLDAARVRHPAFVRYCWADSPVCNMAGADGLPATPFELPVR
jgi:sialate O-acetylesterase